MRRFILKEISSDKPLRVMVTDENVEGEIVKIYLLLNEEVSPDTRVEILTSDNEVLCDLKTERKEVLLYPRNFNIVSETAKNEPRFVEGSYERYFNFGYLIIRLSNVSQEDFNKPIIKILKIIVK